MFTWGPVKGVLGPIDGHVISVLEHVDSHVIETTGTSSLTYTTWPAARAALAQTGETKGLRPRRRGVADKNDHTYVQ
jgi:hypothetical protein